MQQQWRAAAAWGPGHIPRALRSARTSGSGALLLSAVALAACHPDAAGPSQARPPYIAVVSKIEAGALPDPNVRFQYRVTDLSTGGVLDTTVILAPADTLILSVRPASYQIKLENLPAKCVSRYGTTDVVVVPEGTNTAIARFFISCNPPLAVTLFTLGGPDVFQFVWDLEGPGGSHQTGFVTRREDVVILNPLAPGSYIFSVYNVPSDCDVTSPGHRSQRVTVTPEGGSLLQFSIICSQPAFRPELRKFRWSYHDSVAAFYVEAHDSDANLVGYMFDLTDCAGNSVLRNGAVERGGLQSWSTYLNPDPVFVAVIQLDLANADVRDRCASLRLIDDFGNTTPLVERLQTPAAPFLPIPSRYNAQLAGPERLVTVLDVDDPAGVYVGFFVALQLRDGLLGTPDGHPDIGLYTNQGFLPGTQIPDVEFGPGRKITNYGDVQAQLLYLVDREGRFRRFIDADLFH